MPALLIASASLLAAPLMNQREVSAEDYPDEFMRKGKSAPALIEAIVSPEGRVVQCRELSTFGDADFAQKICTTIKPRTWRAAANSQGKPEYGVVQALMRWFIPDTKQGDALMNLTYPTDVVLTVAKLPSGVTKTLKVSIEVVAGRVVACEPRRERNVPAVFALEACERVRMLEIGQVSLAGSPLPRFVMEVSVGFTADQPR